MIHEKFVISSKLLQGKNLMWIYLKNKALVFVLNCLGEN